MATDNTTTNQIWQHRLLQLDYLPAGELARRFNLLNPRLHPEAQKDATETSLEKVQWIDEVSLSTNGDGPPSLADNPDAVLFDGHERVEIVLSRFGPDALVPVKWYQLSKEETDFALLVKDQTTGMAEYIPERLAELMERTRTMTADSRLAGMLERLREKAGMNGKGQAGRDVEPQIDKAAELRQKWGVELGQLWQLGEHRLICGDCTDRMTVEKLMGGERADMVFTDPPYNLAGDTELIAANAIRDSYGKLKDSDWDKEFDILPALDVLFTDAIDSDVSVYICTSQFLAGDIWNWMRGWADFYNYIVWCKSNPMPSLSKRHWTWATELLAYATKGKHEFNFPFDGHALNWWVINRESHETDHPTEKPIEVPSRAIEHSSKTGQVIFDGFLGSGTTLIACENLNRRCRAIEIDPGYVAVTLQRWADLTGLTPTLVSVQGA